jgi:glycerol-3-phosphate dehydrogenase
MQRFMDDYKNESFDILVIGGGITGAAVAYNAAIRGLNVALKEILKAAISGIITAQGINDIH